MNTARQRRRCCARRADSEVRRPLASLANDAAVHACRSPAPPRLPAPPALAPPALTVTRVPAPGRSSPSASRARPSRLQGQPVKSLLVGASPLPSPLNSYDTFGGVAGHKSKQRSALVLGSGSTLHEQSAGREAQLQQGRGGTAVRDCCTDLDLKKNLLDTQVRCAV